MSILYSQDTLSTIKDSLTVKSNIDTLKVLKSVNLFSSFNHSFISKDFFLLAPHRTTANFLEYAPFSFNSFSNIAGQPYNQFYYNNNSNFSIDGINVFNRFNSSYDLNYLQTELIDTIFLTKSYNAFYFSNSSQLINFSSSDKFYTSPYTRIKYTQGPNQDSYVDGIFNVFFTNKFGLHFQITHSHIDSTFANDLSSYWQGNIKFKYILSNSLQFNLNYRHNTSQVNLNGGLVDTVNYNSYDELSSVPFFSNRYNKNFSNFITLTTLFKLSESNILQLKIYSNSYEDNYRLNENYNTNKVINDYKETRNGIKLVIPYNTSFFETMILLDYENYSFNNFYNSIKFSNQMNLFSLAPKIKFNLDIFSFSFYSKYLNYNKNSYLSFGAETKAISNSLNVDLGASYSEIPLDIYNIQKQSFDILRNREMNIEASINYLFDNSNTKISIFLKKTNYNPVFYAISSAINDRFNILGFNTEDISFAGINSLTQLNFDNFEINNNISVYKHNSKIEFIPNFNVNFSIYYKNIFFNESLNLKAGIRFEVWDKIPYYTNDYILNQNLQYYKNDDLLNPISEYKGEFMYKIDLVSASRIKENAILYLTVENILGSMYHKTPFHPGRARSFVFSIRWEFFD